MSLIEDVVVSGAGGSSNGVVSCKFGAAGDTTGKAVRGRAVGERGDDGEDENLEDEVLEGKHFD